MSHRSTLLATGLAAVTVVACGDSGTDPLGSPTSVIVGTTALELFVPESRDLTARVLDANGRAVDAAVAWSSGDPSVAAVDAGGRLTAAAVGETFVEARLGTLADSVRVTVLPTMDFAFPLEGVLNQDFYYVNYVDLDPGPGIQDYRCGPKSYDGHRGVDLTLPSFQRMDEGVRILAAAPGTVLQALDGEYDRSTANGPGGFGNHVRIRHQNGFESVYGHMAQGSVAVSVGQGVAAGEFLGLVGSSGNSDMPHLHVEFLRNGTTVDAFAGSCGDPVDHWEAAHPYQDRFALIQSGLTGVQLDLDQVKAPPAAKDTFRTDDPRITGWVHLHNVRQGSTSRFDLYDPAGNLFASHSFVHDRFWSMSWWWFWHGVAGAMTPPGTWRMEYRNDGTLLAEHAFELVEAGAGAGAGAGVTGPLSGSGGGGSTGG